MREVEIFLIYSSLNSSLLGDSLAVQWLGVRTSTTGGTGSIPGQGTKIPQATPLGQKKKKNLSLLKTSLKLTFQTWFVKYFFLLDWALLLKSPHLLLCQLCVYFPPKQWISTGFWFHCLLNRNISKSGALFSSETVESGSNGSGYCVTVFLKTQCLPQRTKLPHYLPLE